MTPELQGIADYRVQAESAAVIGTASQFFAHQLDVPKVGVLGISFSGGLALVAATDPQYSSSIAWIATVGAYYDLAHVLRFFATGEAERPDGTFEHLTPHEYGPLIVVLDRPGDFFPPQDADKATEAIKLVLADEGKKSEALTAQMTPAGQEVMQRIYHKQLDSFRQAILAEIDKDREQLAAASPAGRLGFSARAGAAVAWLRRYGHPSHRAAVAEAKHSAAVSARGLGQSGNFACRGRTQGEPSASSSPLYTGWRS